MPRRSEPSPAAGPPAGPTATDAQRGEAARRVRLGEFYLDWRWDRQRYAICWYDGAARTRRRKLTDIGPGSGPETPIAAQQALAAHFAGHARPAQAQEPAEASVSAIFSRYLTEHCAGLRFADKDALAVQHFEEYLADQRRAGLLPVQITVGNINGRLIDGFVAAMQARGNVGETINRKLATIRAALNWARKNEIITAAPYIKASPESLLSGPRDLEWSPEQVAAILEAAASEPARHHVRDFAMVSLSTHARTDAILECDLAQQLRVVGDRQMINWLVPGDRLTRKRRSTVPVAPTLWQWLEGRTGKLIQYRVPIAERRWKEEGVPEYETRPTWDIGNALARTVVAAGIAHPSLRLVRPMLDESGNQMVRHFTRKDPASGRVPDPQPLWEPIARTPNTFRHTCHTYLQTMGVPQAQIDLAAGHVAAEKGSGRNYTHLRPEYLRELIQAVEAYWSNLDTLTRAHRRTQCGPKIITLPTRPAKVSA
jgi:hypothetical protein